MRAGWSDGRQLQTALNNRVIIEQAKGALAERHAMTADHAFTRRYCPLRPTGQRAVRAGPAAGSLELVVLDLSGVDSKQLLAGDSGAPSG